MYRTIKLLLFLFLASCSSDRDDTNIKLSNIDIKQQPHNNIPNLFSEEEKREALIENKNIILLLLPLSGVNEKLGKGILNACILAASKMQESSDAEFRVIDIADHTGRGNAIGNDLYKRFNGTNLKAIIGPVFSQEAKKVGMLFPDTPIFTFSNNISVNNGHVFSCGLSPQDEVRRIFSYARQKKIDTFLIMLPNDKMGDDTLKCVKSEVKISNFSNRDVIEIMRYDNISIKDATRYANNSGKKSVFIIDPIVDRAKLRNIMKIFTLSPQALSDMKAWNGSVFAFAESEELHRFVEEYAKTFGNNPTILDIIAFDIVKAVYKMLLNESETEEAFNPTSGQYSGCMGRFCFRKNKGIRRHLLLFQH